MDKLMQMHLILTEGAEEYNATPPSQNGNSDEYLSTDYPDDEHYCQSEPRAFRNMANQIPSWPESHPSVMYSNNSTHAVRMLPNSSGGGIMYESMSA